MGKVIYTFVLVVVAIVFFYGCRVDFKSDTKSDRREEVLNLLCGTKLNTFSVSRGNCAVTYTTRKMKNTDLPEEYDVVSQCLATSYTKIKESQCE
jgi:hypothetical protein